MFSLLFGLLCFLCCLCFVSQTCSLVMSHTNTGKCRPHFFLIKPSRIMAEWWVGGIPHAFVRVLFLFMGARARGALAVDHRLVLISPQRFFFIVHPVSIWFFGFVTGFSFALWILLCWCIFLWTDFASAIHKICVCLQLPFAAAFKPHFLHFSPLLKAIVWQSPASSF